MNKSEILDYIRTSPEPVDKRQIARKFKLKGSGPRVALKKILRELEQDGEIARHKGGGYSVPDGLPSVTVIEVHDIDIDGDVFARPVEWKPETQGEMPRIEVMPDNKGHPALTQGDRVLARLKRLQDGTYEARTIKHLGADDNQVLGLLRVHKRGAVLVPADKKGQIRI